MSITPGKSSNSTGFLRETDLHLVTPSFVKVNRSTGQPGNHDIQLFLQSGGRAQMILTWLPVWFLSVNVPASILLSRWLPTNRKCGAFHSKAACRHLHPSVLFLLLCKNVTAFVILAPGCQPPHCGTNPSDGSTAAKIRAFICYINTQGAQLALINSREF